MPEDIRTIISTDNPRMLLDGAIDLAGRIRRPDETTKTQVRRIYSTMKQIELSWPIETTDTARVNRAYRKLMLLHPRLSYQAVRHDKIKVLATELQKAILSIGPQDRDKLQRLMEFFEAVLAFSLSGQTSLEEGGN